MKPLEKLDQVTTVDGKELALYRRSEDFYIKIDGSDLMTSRAHGSEEEMARLAWRGLGRVPPEPQVLVGGLGMGYTLRATLDQLPDGAKVVVAEVFPQVVRWNRELLGHLARHPLSDPRVLVEKADVNDLLRIDAYDMILFDVDSGPNALTLAANHRLYDDAGLARLRQALKAGGVLSIWSVSPDSGFTKRMRRAGFEATRQTVWARSCAKGGRHAIFLGRKKNQERTRKSPKRR
jgi:spermidine synthase